jgi:hypothetical protein
MLCPLVILGVSQSAQPERSGRPRYLITEPGIGYRFMV